jgi:hypothetical protein
MIPFARPMLALVLCCLGIVPCPADDTTAPPAPVTDPQLVGEHYRQVLERPEFQPVEGPTVNAQFKDWLSRFFMRLGARFGEFKYAAEMPGLASLLLIALATASVTALLYISFRLFKRSGETPQDESGSSAGPKIFHPPEYYDEEIGRAMADADWHTAWLATWRQFLSRLEARHLVEADRTRTNREYLEQLRAQALPGPTLALLTAMVDAYDLFIYGHKRIGEPEWRRFRRQTNEAALLLHLDGRTSRVTTGGSP